MPLLEITLTSGRVMRVPDSPSARYIKLKHEKYHIAEGQVVSDNIRKEIERATSK